MRLRSLIFTFTCSIGNSKATPKDRLVRHSSELEVWPGGGVLAQLVTDVPDLRAAETRHVEVGAQGGEVQSVARRKDRQSRMIAGENLLLYVLLGTVAVGSLASPLAQGPEIHSSDDTRVWSRGGHRVVLDGVASFAFVQDQVR